MNFSRQIEIQGSDGLPSIATGPKGETDNICLPGELTDKGRATTLALGQRLRHLYVDQLRFMPQELSSLSSIYLRSTMIPRAFESVQQAFYGFYPPEKRAADLALPIITQRALADETLFPNEGGCRRFRQLARAFADRAAQQFNDSTEMAYLNKRLGRWMPEASPKVAVDSHPRMGGIMDTIFATQSHGPSTRLPAEFYDPKVVEHIERMSVQEWFDGYGESREYRVLGIGGLVADVTTRMILHAEQNRAEVSPHGPASVVPNFGLSGAHDTTIAAFLASLGAFENENWPPYTSHIAIELFRKKDYTKVEPAGERAADTAGPAGLSNAKSWWSSIPLLSSIMGDPNPPSIRGPHTAATTTIARKRSSELDADEKALLQNHFVRIRYNDQPKSVPGCRAPGSHLPGDLSFCTLEAFKAIVEDFAPQDWKAQCRQNLDAPKMPAVKEPAGLVPSDASL